MPWIFLIALVCIGCAPTTAFVDGRTVPRLTLDYAGQPFAIRQLGAHPKPGGASSGLRDYGGRIIGNVCGLDVNYEVQHEGDYVRLTGFLDDATYNSSITVRDDGGIRRLISGSLAPTGGAVALELRYNGLRGHVGLRVFELAREGDHYIGSLTVGQSLRALARIDGAAELWSLPAAAQGLVLPALLTCNAGELEDRLRGALIVGFGSNQTFEAKRVSSIYHVTTDDVQGNLRGTAAAHTQAFGR
jgi:hypothetical protein